MENKIISSSLFHFTRKEDVFIKILSNGLRLSYSFEKVTGDLGYLMPMICFCDIPLEFSKSHTDDYGKFGIGLCKEYMITKSKFAKLTNPVLYGVSANICDGISVFDHIQEQLLQIQVDKCLNYGKIFVEYTNEKKDSNYNNWFKREITELLNLSFSLEFFVGYYKPYNGWDDKLKKDKTFYEEREWRIITPKEYEYFQWEEQDKNPGEDYIKELSNNTFNDKAQGFLIIEEEDFDSITDITVSKESEGSVRDFIMKSDKLFGTFIEPNSPKRKQLINKLRILD